MKIRASVRIICTNCRLIQKSIIESNHRDRINSTFRH